MILIVALIFVFLLVCRIVNVSLKPSYFNPFLATQFLCSSLNFCVFHLGSLEDLLVSPWFSPGPSGRPLASLDLLSEAFWDLWRAPGSFQTAPWILPGTSGLPP